MTSKRADLLWWYESLRKSRDTILVEGDADALSLSNLSLPPNAVLKVPAEEYENMLRALELEDIKVVTSEILENGDIVVRWGTGGGEPKAPGRITRPPGTLLNRLAEFFFSPDEYERVLKRVIDDMRIEIFDALAQDRVWKARWVRVCGTIAFWRAARSTMLGSLIESITKRVAK